MLTLKDKSASTVKVPAATALTPAEWSKRYNQLPTGCRVIYLSPYGGGTEISEPGSLQQCAIAFGISLARGWLRQGNGRRMLITGPDTTRAADLNDPLPSAAEALAAVGYGGQS